VVTHQLKVKCVTGKVRQLKTNVQDKQQLTLTDDEVDDKATALLHSAIDDA